MLSYEKISYPMDLDMLSYEKISYPMNLEVLSYEKINYPMDLEVLSYEKISNQLLFIQPELTQPLSPFTALRFWSLMCNQSINL